MSFKKNISDILKGIEEDKESTKDMFGCENLEEFSSKLKADKETDIENE